MKPGFTFHGLRHTPPLTPLLRSGVPVHIVSAHRLWRLLVAQQFPSQWVAKVGDFHLGYEFRSLSHR
jgi:hypothetical protein